MKDTCGGSFSERYKDARDSLPNSYPVFQSEIKIIKNRLPKSHIETEDSIKPGTQHLLTGLALSGGGIRSATFNLGLLQALCCERPIYTYMMQTNRIISTYTILAILPAYASYRSMVGNRHMVLFSLLSGV